MSTPCVRSARIPKRSLQIQTSIAIAFTIASIVLVILSRGLQKPSIVWKKTALILTTLTSGRQFVQFLLNVL